MPGNRGERSFSKIYFFFFWFDSFPENILPRKILSLFLPLFLVCVFLFKRCLVSLPFSKHILWRFLSIWPSFSFFNENLESPSSYLRTLISPSKRRWNRQPTRTQIKKPHAGPAMQLFTPLSSPCFCDS